jgi:hypothetical protein
MPVPSILLSGFEGIDNPGQFRFSITPEDSDHIKTGGLSFQAVPLQVPLSQASQPPLLASGYGFLRKAVVHAGTGPYFNEYDGSSVPADQVDFTERTPKIPSDHLHTVLLEVFGSKELPLLSLIVACVHGSM